MNIFNHDFFQMTKFHTTSFTFARLFAEILVYILLMPNESNILFVSTFRLCTPCIHFLNSNY
jgi:hypothetical protein